MHEMNERNYREAEPNTAPSDADLRAMGYYFAPCPGCGTPELLHAAALGLCPRCLARRQEDAEREEWARLAERGICPDCGRGRLPEDCEYGGGCRCLRPVD